MCVWNDPESRAEVWFVRDSKNLEGTGEESSDRSMVCEGLGLKILEAQFPVFKCFLKTS